MREDGYVGYGVSGGGEGVVKRYVQYLAGYARVISGGASPPFASSSLVRVVGSRYHIVLGPIPKWDVREWAEPSRVRDGMTEGAGHEVDRSAGTFEFRWIGEGVEIGLQFRPNSGDIGWADGKHVVMWE